MGLTCCKAVEAEAKVAVTDVEAVAKVLIPILKPFVTQLIQTEMAQVTGATSSILAVLQPIIISAIQAEIGKLTSIPSTGSSVVPLVPLVVPSK